MLLAPCRVTFVCVFVFDCLTARTYDCHIECCNHVERKLRKRFWACEESEALAANLLMDFMADAMRDEDNKNDGAGGGGDEKNNNVNGAEMECMTDRFGRSKALTKRMHSCARVSLSIE